MAKYYVTIKIDARYIAEVDANSIEEAKIKANQEFSDADFGKASDIDGECIIIEDEDEELVWEKD